MRFSTKGTVAILVLLKAQQLFASFNFDVYPPCAQPFLSETAPESCDYGFDTYDSGKCLCSDSAWLKNAAEKIQGGCDCATLASTANTVIILCGSYVTLSAEQILAAGGCSTGSGSSLSAGPTPGTAAPSKSSNAGHNTRSHNVYTAQGNSGGGDSNDSPTSDKIALGVGLGIGLPTLLIAAITLWLKCIKGMRQ